MRAILISLLMWPALAWGWKMEGGSVTLPATTAGSTLWQPVTLQQTFDTVPLIFVLPDDGSGYAADSPAALRIRNVTTEGFEIVQVEPQPDDGAHAAMAVHYLAVEAGEHTLFDGTRIVAGTIDTTLEQGKNSTGTTGWESVTFSSTFSAAPVVLGMIQSLNNETSTLPGSASAPWMASVIRNVTITGFETALGRAETSTGTVGTAETIGYLAIDAAVSTTLSDSVCSDVTLMSVNTGSVVRGWGNSCYLQSFGTPFAASPGVVGSLQTRNGGDGGWLRRCSLSTSEVGLTVEEDQSADTERNHTSETVGLLIFERDFVFDSAASLGCGLQVNFRMDECYWLGGANGVTDDVRDSADGALHGQSRNRADNTETNYKICRGGDFNNTYADQSQSDAVFYPNNTTAELAVGDAAPFSVSAWLYRKAGGDKWMAAVIKISDDGWTDGWGLEHNSGAGSTIYFFVGDYTVYASATLATETWTHVVGTYDGTTIRIYTDGVLQSSQVQGSYSAGALAVSIGDDISGSAIDDRWQGNIDEVKIWDRALSAGEIAQIYASENSGLNFDGSARSCPACSGVDIAAGTWELIGIPAEHRSTPLSVSDLFIDDMRGTFDVDWRVYKRTYSTTDNSSAYVQMGLSDPLEFGQGYWLGSRLDERWDVDGTSVVDYNASANGTADCVSTTGRCTEIPLTPVTHNFGAPDYDSDDGTGAYRYNMTGFIGLQDPVDWADCRLLFDDNGTYYTPSDANASGLASKQIWLYDPSNGLANSNGYTTCSDTSPGGCKLVPFNGFWIQLQGRSKNRSVKLIVPEK